MRLGSRARADEKPPEVSPGIPTSGFWRIFGALQTNPYYRTYWFGNQASTLMTWALAPLSSAPFGVMVDHIGGPETMLIIGGALATFVVAMATFHPGYRRLT